MGMAEDFIALPSEEKIKVLSTDNPEFKAKLLSSINSEFAGLDPAEQQKVVSTATPDQMMKIIAASIQPPAPAKPELTLGSAMKKGLMNIPGEAVDMVSGLATMATSPIQTLRGVTGLMQGTADIIGGDPNTPQARGASAMGRQFIDPWTSWEGFKQGIATRPLGMGMDVSMGLGTLGKLAQLGGAARAGDVLMQGAKFAEPVSGMKQAFNVASDLIPAGAKEAMQAKAGRLWESAVKPMNTKAYMRDREKIVRAGLDEGIRPTRGGVEKVENLISDLDNKIDDIIDRSQKSGQTLFTDDVLKPLDDVRAEFGKINSTADLNAIERIEQEIRDKYGKQMSIKAAQEMKQFIYKKLKTEAYGKLGSAEVETYKAVARGAKEEIARLFPEIKDMNMRESMLLKLEPIIEKAVARIEKRDLLGIGTPISGGGVYAVTGSHTAGLVAAITREILEQPNIKATLGIYLNKATKGKLGPGLIKSRIAAYEASRLKDLKNIQPRGVGVDTGQINPEALKAPSGSVTTGVDYPAPYPPYPQEEE